MSALSELNKTKEMPRFNLDLVNQPSLAIDHWMREWMEGRDYGFFELDFSTGWARFNAAFQRILGHDVAHSKDDVHAYFRLFPEAESDPEYLIQRALLDQNGEFDREMKILDAKGELRILRCRAKVVAHDAENQPALVIGILADVKKEDRKRTLILEAIRMGRKSRQAKERFFENLSHQVKTPLNVILGQTYLIQEALPFEDVTSKGRIRQIQEAAQNLHKFLEQIVELAQTDTPAKPEAEEFEIGTLATELEGSWRSIGEAKGLDWMMSVNHDSHPTGVRYQGDYFKIRQIMNVLVDNAIRYSTEGKVRIGMELQKRSGSEERFSFFVEDQGIGIPAQELPLLFDPFWRLSRDALTPWKDTGLSLAIAQQMAHYLGSEIKVSSEPGKGSRFSLDISLRLAETTAPEKAQPNVPSSSKLEVARRFSGCNILLAEDDPICQIMTSDILAAAGLKVTIAPDGESAISMFKDRPFDAVLMDIRMPNVDGFKATRAIRNLPNGSSVPIIALTANGISEDSRQVKRSGMDRLIEKPFDPEFLFSVLLDFLERAKAEQNANAPLKRPENEPTLDEAQGLLRCSNNPKTYRDLIRQLLEDPAYAMNNILEEMVLNPEEAKRRCHTLKGAAALLGANGLSHAALKLERAISRRARTETLKSLMAEVGLEQEKIRLHLETRIH